MRNRRATALALLLALGCAPFAGERYRAPAWPPPEQVLWSLLAVGDTGKPPFLTHRWHSQLRVGLALAAEDAALPAHALLILGDNFYWDGLRHGELVDRVRDNVVRPFCRFVDLRGPRSAEVADACERSPEERRPIPLYAILGNHDYDSPESPQLQRTAIPQFVSNWSMPAGVAERVEFDAGISLVLVDSVALRNGADPAPLYAALAQSRGPWRILAAHHPMAAARDKGGAALLERRRYRELIRDAIAASGYPVHVFLAGHEHNLQVITSPDAAPALHVVAGSGSRVREPRTSNSHARFVLDELGFARVDLVGSGAEARLVVSLFSVSSSPFFATPARALETRWAITPEGEARALPLVNARLAVRNVTASSAIH